MSPNRQTSSPQPWHRQPWPWILMAAPFVAVVWGMATLYIAVKYQDPLVTEHAWEDGQRLQQGLPVTPSRRPADQ